MSKEEREILIEEIINNIEQLKEIRKEKQNVTPASPSKSSSR